MHFVLSDDSWNECIKQFAESVRHITGQSLGVTLADDVALHDELESLRAQLDKTNAEV